MVFNISLIDNAVDELNSIRCDLELYNDIANSDDIPVNEQYFAIKRIIKQIDCAWELFMKYRLQLFDISLLFEKSQNITFEQLQTGNFHTIYKKEAIRRLKDNGITASFTHLEKIAQYRNKIEHYQVEASLEEVLRAVVNAIDELSDFYKKQISIVCHNAQSLDRGNKMLAEVHRAKDHLSNMIDEALFAD